MTAEPAKTISLTGARGGSGTTTLTILLALHHNAGRVVGEPDEIRLIAGIASDKITDRLEIIDHYEPEPGLAIIDEGSLRHPQMTGHADDHTSLLVVRGPSYEALSTIMRSERFFDGFILLAEPHRALSRHDVEEVTGLDCILAVSFDPAIGRGVDAGLLVARHAATPLQTRSQRYRLASPALQ